MFSFAVIAIVLSATYPPVRPLQNAGHSTNQTFFRLPGDLQLGGLFAVHSEAAMPDSDNSNGTTKYSTFNVLEFLGLLAMKFAVDRINNSSYILPNTTLGYEILDTSLEKYVALRAALQFLAQKEDKTLPMVCNYTGYETQTVAVIGPATSDMVIATARLFGFFRLPQISYQADSEIFSDKTLFPSFLRTIPGQKALAQGITALLKEFQWNWVAAVTSGNEYDEQQLFQFTTEASQDGICVAYQAVLPQMASSINFNISLQKLMLELQNSGVNVTIVFSAQQEVQAFFTAIIASQMKMVWIASTSWSQSTSLQQMPGIESIGTVIGFAATGKPLTGFEDYVQSALYQIQQESQVLFNDSMSKRNISHAFQYQDLLEKCESCRSLTPGNLTMLEDPVVPSLVYRVYIAVYCIAQATHNTLQGLQSDHCKDASSIFPWQILQELKSNSFTLDNITFDVFGNPNLGFDILTWRYNETNPFYKVGAFQNKLYFRRSQIAWYSKKIPESTCSRQCSAGQVKKYKDFKSCCFECVTCPEGTFANSSGCATCPSGTWSNAGSQACQEPVFVFLTWTNYFVIANLGFMGVNIVLLCTVFAFLFQHRHTPLLLACGEIESYMILFGLALSCVSIVFYIGQPTHFICHLQQPMLSIGFTISLGPILVKSMQLLLSSLTGGSCLYWLIFPGRWIILTCTFLGQFFFCAFYMKSSECLESMTSLSINSLTVYLSCEIEPLLQFGLMFAYNGLLVLVSFICSFMAEKPVHHYSMARDITMSMLMLILAWIIFIPTYVSTIMAYKSLIQMGFILISSLGVLSTLFFPKLYILFVKKEINSSEYFGMYFPKSQGVKDTE